MLLIAIAVVLLLVVLNGLFAMTEHLSAIPAVVAYNRFSYDIDRLANRFDTFIDEFSNILSRHAN